MAKTHLALADDPAHRGHPEGFTPTIRDVRASVGAGCLCPIAGQMITLPDLSARPGSLQVDLGCGRQGCGPELESR